MSSLPLWARALRGIDRLAWYAYHAHEITRDELLFAFLSPELRSEATVSAYSDMRTYLPGGATFEDGLFAWEEALLAQACVPRSGRVLLGAAGGGREMKALLDRGYEVTAFEPNPVLIEGARRVANGSTRARVVQATYADLVAAAGHVGPLASLEQESFDLVLFGWGSFTHLTELPQQLAVLRAARALAPRAPLAMSFFLRTQQELPGSRSARWRQGVRKALKLAGSSRTPEPGLGYDFGNGFVYSFSIDEITGLAERAGYRVELCDQRSFPYAVLAPV